MRASVLFIYGSARTRLDKKMEEFKVDETLNRKIDAEQDQALEHSFEMKLFYCVQIAIWTWTGFSCKYLEERRKDYAEMMLHHCVTIALMLFSQINNQHAIGLVVVFCHDLSDVFLDLMKMSNYLKLVSRCCCCLCAFHIHFYRREKRPYACYSCISCIC